MKKTASKKLSQPVLLVVDDEVSIRDMIRFALELGGFTVLEAANAQEAASQISKQRPDLILLDWMLPGKTGIEFAQRLKQSLDTRDIPIIMLTAKAEEGNKIKGLEAGADDYVTKPFSPRELMARIKTVLRRGPLLTVDDAIQIQDLHLNVSTHVVKVRDQLLSLTSSEYKLLHFFLTHQERVYTREQLIEQVWGGESDIDSRAVDMQIRRLRARLKPYNYDTFIKTVHGMGYQFSGKMP